MSIRTTLLIACLVSLALTPLDVAAQNQAADAAPSAPVLTPVKLDVVISRYQAEKRVSSLPYAMSVNANGSHSIMRMGADVPVPTLALPTVDRRPIDAVDPSVPVGGGPVQYKQIGTHISVGAASLDNVRFDVTVSLRETSIYDDSQLTPGLSRVGAPPVFRSFETTNSLLLRHGESTEFTAATDRITGETIRVEVRLTVVE